ncbi:EI24 domain-containing protein [Rhodoferax sp.]|uniref:EI24 domain-containing protein n=1 Tax=Rhodoferax sp. TaxID=50421 RepID=UPI002ACE3625|nr:EI24 domain-containing protein [Rhodoferax sp.]MDZ7920547.1 EI24 domain-containing protein [Rhodoferax sp.]
MNAMLDAFWRSVAYCLHPKVIGLSLLPLLLVIGLIVGLGYFYMDPALAAVQELLESSDLLNQLWSWLESIGAGKLKTVLVPLIVIALATPVIVVASLLVVATLMTPMIVRLVTQRRFPALERTGGASYLVSVFWGLGASLTALVLLVLSMPLWFVPPLVLVLPPLIWGWLTYRVLAFDALADHATAEERHTLMRRHRWWLLGMGIFTGYLGAAPSLVWSVGFVAVALAPVLVPLSIWLYTLIFAFSSLWFTHYCLAALQQLRLEQAATLAQESLPVADVLELP